MVPARPLTGDAVLGVGAGLREGLCRCVVRDLPAGVWLCAKLVRQNPASSATSAAKQRRILRSNMPKCLPPQAHACGHDTDSTGLFFQDCRPFFSGYPAAPSPTSEPREDVSIPQ
uniref:Uncharacterized protein n=1 Tax=Acidomonas methanolica TaxID=437 RepID=U3T0H9_ACIMT|nr:hypothetical protein [Acidomonas methanolica]